MAYGGGKFLFYNKVRAGAYINFISVDRPLGNFSDRGYVAVPMELDWGTDNEMITVTAGEFQTNSKEIFGYDYTHEKMRNLRELFVRAKTAHIYKLNSQGVKASNEVATARCGGIRGNDIKIVVAKNVDDSSLYDVTVYLDAKIVDQQTVATMEAIAENPYVTFKKGWGIAETAGMPLSGGTNGAAITGDDYQKFLDLSERKYYNVLICPSGVATIQQLFMAYTKRRRDDVGVKFQAIVWRNNVGDHEGIISPHNSVLDDGALPSDIVYWLGGAEASAAVNESLTNTTYDGELTIDMKYKDAEFDKLKLQGFLTFHSQGKRTVDEYVYDTRVMEDINTFHTFVPDKNDDFSLNQIIRVLDQVAIDCSEIFVNSYLGKVQNDNIGRISFRNNLIYQCQEYERVRAIEDFNSDDVLVEKGLKKGDVLVDLPIKPVGAMSHLYMQVYVY